MAMEPPILYRKNWVPPVNDTSIQDKDLLLTYYIKHGGGLPEHRLGLPSPQYEKNKYFKWVILLVATKVILLLVNDIMN